MDRDRFKPVRPTQVNRYVTFGVFVGILLVSDPAQGYSKNSPNFHIETLPVRMGNQRKYSFFA